MQNAYCDVAKGSKEAKIQRDRKSLNINSPKKTQNCTKTSKNAEKNKKICNFFKALQKAKNITAVKISTNKVTGVTPFLYFCIFIYMGFLPISP